MSVWLDEARSYPKGAVATPHYLATAAGAAMLADGGNAVDAALAANLVLAVVTPYLCGFGGDLLTMVWDGDVHAYRGVGRAPAAATLDAVRSRAGSDVMPVFGPHPVTVPGAVDGWFTMLGKWGTRSFGDVAATALRYAEDGFPLTPQNRYMADTLVVAPGSRYDILVHATEPGAWAFHCHILPHVEGPEGMYGMVTALVVQ